MTDDKALGHLLQIEAEAAALVNDAQAEADRRLIEGEKWSHAVCEEQYRAEAARLEAELQTKQEKVKARYQTELAAYREKLASLTVDAGRFSGLLIELINADAHTADALRADKPGRRGAAPADAAGN
jgi:septal ring factor EnvC (AmiA/AmiB activator)